MTPIRVVRCQRINMEVLWQNGLHIRLFLSVEEARFMLNYVWRSEYIGLKFINIIEFLIMTPLPYEITDFG